MPADTELIRKKPPSRGLRHGEVPAPRAQGSHSGEVMPLYQAQQPIVVDIRSVDGSISARPVRSPRRL